MIYNNSLIKKEFTFFFGSSVGWIAPILFLLAINSMLWIIPGAYNLPESGYADPNHLFSLIPWLLILIAPALTMQSFASEFQSGNFELLVSRPIKTETLVLSKFFALFFIGFILIIFTLINLITLQLITANGALLDWGIILSAYVSTSLLLGSFISLGIFASAITKNTISAFLIALLLSFIVFTGFSLLADISFLQGIKPVLLELSIKDHFYAINRGIIHFNELAFFVLFILFFLSATVQILKVKK